jgi:hypothetical protein
MRLPPAGEAAAGGDDFMAKLQQLAELKAAGVLSDEEFTAAKANLPASRQRGSRCQRRRSALTRAASSSRASWTISGTGGRRASWRSRPG